MKINKHKVLLNGKILSYDTFKFKSNYSNQADINLNI